MTNLIDATEVFASKRDVLNDWFVEAVNDITPVKLPGFNPPELLYREVKRACGGMIFPEDLLVHINRTIVPRFRLLMAALLMADQQTPIVLFADHLPDESALIPPLIFGLGMVREVNEHEAMRVSITLKLHILKGVANKEPETQQITETNLENASALSFLSPAQVAIAFTLMGCDTSANEVTEEQDLIRFNWLDDVTFCVPVSKDAVVVHDITLHFETYDPAEKE